MADTDTQLDEVFCGAIEIAAPEERAAFIRRSCGADEGMRVRVERLVDAHFQAGSFLEAPPDSPTLSMTPAPLGEWIGTAIGPYRLLQQIGEGGMGTVFMAEQTRPVHRKVAVKVIKPGMDTRQVIARFEAERQALALMDHVNIARVLDAGATESGRLYFVMELIHGVPINRYCDENRLTPRERLELFVPVCQAIQHAHQKGIIHRDIKPSNVLITLYDGKPVPKVIDFGVAKATEQKLTERTLFTQYGTLVGTLEYMSPEQAEMSALGVDTRSDIYSLGVLLYELLTGSTPLDRKRVREAAYGEILRMIREEEPPRPSMRLSDSGESLASISAQRHMEPARLTKLVRGELDWIVMKTLEKDRNRRYETANGLAADLRRYLDDESVTACPPSAMYRFRKFVRRNRLTLGMGALVAAAAVVAVGALAVSYVRIRRETEAKQEALLAKGAALSTAQANYQESRRQEQIAARNALQAEEQRGIAQKNEAIARTQTSLARRRLYASQMNMALEAARNGELPRVLELLEGQRPTESGEDLRGFEWYYLWRLVHGVDRIPVKGHERAVLGLKFAPDGRTFATASWDGTVRIWDAFTGAEVKVLRGHASGPWAVRYSPDGRLLASSGQETGSLIVWDVESGKALHTILRSVGVFGFSPDSRRLAGSVATGDRIDAVMWDTASGAESQRIEGGGQTLGFSADGRRLLTFSGQYSPAGEFQCWDLESSRQLYRRAVPWLQGITLSPDQTRVLAATGLGTTLWDAGTGEQMKQIPVLDGRRGVALSRDNRLLAYGSDNRRAIVADIETGRTILEDIHADSCWTVDFSPDGTKVATASVKGTIHVRDLKPSEPSTIPRAESISELAFSADGRRLFVTNRGRTKILDVAQGKAIGELPQTDIKAISADLKTLARAEGDGRLTAWETDSGRVIAELPSVINHAWPRLSLAPDGKHLATHDPWRPSSATLILWDLGTGRPRSLKSDHSGVSILSSEFSPDGSLLAAGFQFYWVTVWDAESGRVRCEIQLAGSMVDIISLAWAPDGRMLAAGTDKGYAAILDTRSGEWTKTIRGHAMGVLSLAFSPDGKTLATGSYDKTIRLWDALTGQERGTLGTHTGHVTRLKFSPDRAVLASASHDGEVKLWRASMQADAIAKRPDPRPGATGPDEAFEKHQAALAMLRGQDTTPSEAIKAVELAKQAVKAIPGMTTYELTLTDAHYRAGQWTEALAVLDGMDRRALGGDFSPLLRCMVLARLGRLEEARGPYEAVARKIDQREVFDQDAIRYRAEAARLLGLPVPSAADDLPPVATDLSRQFDSLHKTLMELDKRPALPSEDLVSRWKLAREYLRLGWAARDAGDMETSEAAGRSAMSRLVELARDQENGGRFTFEAGQAADLVSVLLQQRGDRKDEALAVAETAAALFQKATVLRPEMIVGQDAVSNTRRRAAGLLSAMGRKEAAAQAEHDAAAAAETAAKLRRPAVHEVIASVRPLIERRDWIQAAKELGRAISDEAVAAEPDWIYQVAMIRLLANDADGANRLIAALPKTLMTTEWPFAISRTLNLHPRAGEPAAVLEAARDAATWYFDPAGGDDGWKRHCLALARYRAGHYAEAIALCTEAPDLSGWRIFLPVLAMSHHRLGHTDEARRWMVRAQAHFREITEGGPTALKATMTPYWEDWAEFEILQREAEKLIEGSPDPEQLEVSVTRE